MRPRPVRARTTLRVLVGDLLRLVVPLGCAGCGAVDVVLCHGCRAALGAGSRRVDGAAPRLAQLPAGPRALAAARPPAVEGGGAPGPGDGLVSGWPVLACAVGTACVRTLVVSWKDRGRTDCTRVLAGRVRDAARDGAVLVADDDLADREVWVVPVPSTRSAVRRRGRDHTVELARAVAEELRVSWPAAPGPPGGPESAPGGTARGAGPPAAVRLVPALVHARRRTVDQTGLGARARWRNLDGALRVRRTARTTSPRPAACVLVDDVLTTGATLAECARALHAAGHEVVLGLVLAATPTSPTSPLAASPHGLLVHSSPETG